MSQQISCLRCKSQIDLDVEACPHCGERVTVFQRTYASKLIDGKYQILERLGMGGMGEIFKVRHIHLNEQRVIKIMRANIATDDQALQRFLHEARTSTMIKHRNLAMLYDFSTLDDGSYYMVWEYIDGTNIQKWIAANGPIPPRMTLEISIQALHGLDHLHAMGLVHRDISPENIMLSQDYQGNLLAKVIDFGIAKQLSEGEGGQGLTQTGMFLGKLKYASPEQAGFIKEGEHIDARSDLYSFGVVMYEMLAGRAPFQASNPHGYILKHATEKPVPISKMNPEISVPPALEAEVLKALEKDRDDRHPSAGQFAAALEALRPQVPQDTKWNVDNWKGTFSSSTTVIDRPATTASGTTSTAPTMADRPVPTQGVGADATVVEKGLKADTFARQRTVVDSDDATRVERIGGANEATVVERLGGGDAAATVVERQAGWGSAEPTLLETKISVPRPGAKKKTPMIAGIAAAVALVVAGAGYMFMQKKPSAVAPTASVTSTATSTAAPGSVTSTAAPAAVEDVAATPLAANVGELQLVANPYATVDRILNVETNKPVQLAGEDASTPLRIELEPGKYRVFVSGPEGEQKTLEVRLDAGARSLQKVTFKRAVDVNQLAEGLAKP